MTAANAMPTNASASGSDAVDQKHELDMNRVSRDFVARVPRDFAREHLIISQGGQDGAELLAVSESSDACAVFNVGVLLKRRITTRITDGEAIAHLIDEAYSDRVAVQVVPEATGIAAPADNIDSLIEEADRNLLSTQGKAPVVRLVDALLFEALCKRGSDLHVQPLAKKTLIRYRLDGVLHTVRELSLAMTGPVVSRIKVMGRMDIAERRIPQDGRAGVTIGDRAIDLRISTIPTSYGERAVIRLLDNTQQLCDLDRLGMPRDVEEHYLERATRANGIILLTGPTGSGKTTTLYSTLRRIGSAKLNIMTIEDPIEYELSSLGDGIAISQAQVNSKKGITFPTGLRHILRQDPDVIMVGEIRDADTARIAIQSSLTGHLVFSTLHTNDAVSAITRLFDLGVEAYLVSASLSAVLAQRLVRTIHQTCKGKGCDACLRTGFMGRTGLFELLVIDEELRQLIAEGADIASLRKKAKQRGMRTLAQEGERLLHEGRTTRAEVVRVVQGVM